MLSPDEIRRWRPKTWSDFCGASNNGELVRLQQAVITRQAIPPSILIAPYGCAKTSTARHIMRCACCEALDTITGDPCQACNGCCRQGPKYNGEWHRIRHWEIDGSRHKRDEIRGILSEAEEEGEAALFFDEFQHLDERSQKLILKPLEDFAGVFLVAVLDDAYRKLDPPLFDRFNKIWLTSPAIEEALSFFQRKAPEWGISADEDAVREMLHKSQCGFRSCLRVLARAAENADRTLDRRLVDEFFPT